MAIDLDDEIFQDFLVEAGEILEKLNAQLIELEQSPDDYDLLNAIFRGFHTIKGGAGFLNIHALVDICHKAEDVFNVLRQGDRRIDAALMDVVLEVLDVVNSMFRYIGNGKDPEPADPDLHERLAAFAVPQGAAPPPPKAAPAPAAPPQVAAAAPKPAPAPVSPPPVAPAPAPAVAASPKPAPKPASAPVPSPSRSSGNVVEDALFAMLEGDDGDLFGEPEGPSADANTPSLAEDLFDGGSPGPAASSAAADDEITEAEFESLLDQLHGTGRPVAVPAPASPPPRAPSDEITDDEFEALLDELHGPKKAVAANPPAVAAAPAAEPGFESEASRPAAESADAADNSAAASPDDITEDEFEALLDDLHGQGQHGGIPVNAKIEAPAAPARPAAFSAEDGGREPPRAAKAAAPPPAETTVRVDTQRLDEIMNMVGELVLVRNRFQTLRAALNDEAIAKAVANLDVVTSDLQLSVMKTRMQPIKKVFGRFPRVVRDLARSLNKEVTLELRGEETDLDKNLVEALADPLVHLVRNAVDHGIEMPDDRVAAGKPREGLVVLTASQEGNHIELTIEDDGKGMDPEMLRAKVVEKGLMDEESAARLDSRECFDLIFMPGFSTKSEISDVSGRGVGMDVVKTRIAQMNGTVAIDSIKGRGSRIIIKLPLTLAIMPTLMVKLNQQPFALPLASVVEILDLDLNRTNSVDGQLVVLVRQRALPLFYLKEWLVPGFYRERPPNATSGHVVVVNVGGRHVGFVVDHLVGQEEVVIKPLGAKLHGVAGMAGATITGDGKIALILDVPGLMKRYAPIR